MVKNGTMEKIIAKYSKGGSLILSCTFLVVPFCISLIVFINNYHLKEAEKAWKFYLSAIGFLCFSLILIIGITVLVILYFKKGTRKKGRAI